MEHARPVFLFTDFGWLGPYVGQLAVAVLARDRRIPVINLMHDAPSMRPDLAAYLLPACCSSLPAGAIVVAVVDPGVGGERDALIVDTDTLTLVGPDNGLMSRMPGIREVRRIDWRPDSLSPSFHGRDVFAPVAAGLAVGEAPACSVVGVREMVGADWPETLAAVIYIDAYGNVMTGVNSKTCCKNSQLVIGDAVLGFAETFSAVESGRPFWYANSQGLVEIAVNRASAAEALALALGDTFLLD